jgi:hypothetical protein
LTEFVVGLLQKLLFIQDFCKAEILKPEHLGCEVHCNKFFSKINGNNSNDTSRSVWLCNMKGGFMSSAWTCFVWMWSVVSDIKGRT